MELVRDRATTVQDPLVSLRAERTIRWDMVLVNSTSRSGVPHLVVQAPPALCKYLGAALIRLAQLLVLAHHALVSADDDNAHAVSSSHS